MGWMAGGGGVGGGKFSTTTKRVHTCPCRENQWFIFSIGNIEIRYGIFGDFNNFNNIFISTKTLPRLHILHVNINPCDKSMHDVTSCGAHIIPSTRVVIITDNLTCLNTREIRVPHATI